MLFRATGKIAFHTTFISLDDAQKEKSLENTLVREKLQFFALYRISACRRFVALTFSRTRTLSRAHFVAHALCRARFLPLTPFVAHALCRACSLSRTLFVAL